MDEEVGTVLMHRQAPVAFGVLASCAVIASGSILLREQILSFSSWPEVGGGAGNAPEIAIPNGRPLALRDAGAVRPGEATRPARTVVARAGVLGLGAGGGTFTLLTPRPVSAGEGTAGGSGVPSGPQLTTVGRTGSGHPDTGPAGDPPLSVYGEGIPVAGNAGSAGSGVSPLASGAVPLVPTAAIRVAAPEAADVAPESDLAPVVSSVDNAPPPSDPVGTPVLVPEPAPEPAPAPDPAPDPAPAPDPTPAPAEPAPPADPAPPVETPAPPTEETPAPPVEAPAPDPAPEVPPAPADPAPPADPEITSEPPPADPAATDPAAASAPTE
jgi:hypothetical protein